MVSRLGRSGGASGYFTGLIDDVRVVHYPFTGTEVAYAMNNVTPALYGTMSVDYTYDHENRLISRVADSDGPVGPVAATTEYYVYDGAQMALRLDAAGEVTNRYLWGPQIDQLLVDEQISNGTSQEGDVLWALTDNLGTVRDLVRYNAGQTTSVLHRSYDAFGNVTAEVNPSEIDFLFGFTGRQFDDATGLQNNLNRWYDAKVGRWISEDPISFAAGDANLYRYVGNSPTNFIDPNGLHNTGPGWNGSIFNPSNWGAALGGGASSVGSSIGSMGSSATALAQDVGNARTPGQPFGNSQGNWQSAYNAGPHGQLANSSETSGWMGPAAMTANVGGLAAAMGAAGVMGATGQGFISTSFGGSVAPGAAFWPGAGGAAAASSSASSTDFSGPSNQPFDGTVGPPDNPTWCRWPNGTGPGEPIIGPKPPPPPKPPFPPPFSNN